MLDVIDYELAGVPLAKKAEKELNFGQEDTFFVSRLMQMNDKQFFVNGRTTNYKIASAEATRLFAASGSWANETVFAASMTLPEAAFEVGGTLVHIYVCLCVFVRVYIRLHTALS